MNRWLTWHLAPLLRRMIAPESALAGFRVELAEGDREDGLFMACATWFLIMCLAGGSVILVTLSASVVPALDVLAQGLLGAMFVALGLVIAHTLAYSLTRWWGRRRGA